jgi:hypothetical protein
MKNPIYFIIIIFFFSCNEDSQKKIDVENSKFSTSDASEIFFKNVRQRDYDRMEMPEAKLNIYRIQERNIDSDYPNLFLAIVINWRHDEAYILLEPNDLVPENEIKVKWVDQKIKNEGEYVFNYGDKASHFVFAGQLYSSINSQHDLFLILDNEEVSILKSDQDRQSFRKTMKDYYRLIDLL